jgi:hypothetical protein
MALLYPKPVRISIEEKKVKRYSIDFFKSLQVFALFIQKELRCPAVVCKRRRSFTAASFDLSVFPIFFALPEQQGNTPESGDPDQGKNYARYCGKLTAANVCDNIKSKNSDASPIERADNRKNKRDSVDDHAINSFTQA